MLTFHLLSTCEQVEMQNRLCSSHTVNCSKISSLVPIFFLDKYVMFHAFHAYILKLLFKVIIVLPWFWSLYALYCLVNVEDAKPFRQTTNLRKLIL